MHATPTHAPGKPCAIQSHSQPPASAPQQDNPPQTTHHPSKSADHPGTAHPITEPKTQHQPFSPWPIDRRLRWAADFRQALAHATDHLLAAVRHELGRPDHETFTAEIMPLLAACRWHERRARNILRPRRLPGRAWWQLAEHHTVLRQPLGNVAIIATWNYPIQLLGIQLLQAIVAGNRVTIKPSERTPITQQLLLEIARHAGATPEILNWTEPTREAGVTLLIENNFDRVIFTGSTAVGRQIAQTLARTLTPSDLELSGSDSAIVLQNADTQLAANAIWDAVTINAGQTCMAPRRVIVHQSIYKPFCDALAPLAAAAQPRRIIDAAAANHAYTLASDAIKHGARSLSGIAEPPTTHPINNTTTLRPLAIADCPRSAHLLTAEHFAPVVAIIPATSTEDALAIHALAPSTLATSIYTRNTRLARNIAPQLGSAVVTINDTLRPTAHPAASIAGRKNSGWGITRGREGLLKLTQPVFLSTTSARSPLRPPTGPPSPKLYNTLKSIVLRRYRNTAPNHRQLLTKLDSISTQNNQNDQGTNA